MCLSICSICSNVSPSRGVPNAAAVAGGAAAVAATGSATAAGPCGGGGDWVAGGGDADRCPFFFGVLESELLLLSDGAGRWCCSETRTASLE